MKRKNFQKYLEKRLTNQEIAEIERDVGLEKELLEKSFFEDLKEGLQEVLDYKKGKIKLSTEIVKVKSKCKK